MSGQGARTQLALRGLGAIAPRAAAGAAGFSLLGAADIGALAEEWDDLAQNAVESNPFFSRWMLGPALGAISGEEVSLLCAWGGGAGAAALIGLLPVVLAVGYARLPISYLRTWIYRHCFYGAPLVRRGHEATFLQSLAAFVDSCAPLGGFLRLPLIDRDGPFAAALAQSGGGRLIYSAGDFERAMLRGGYIADEFIAQHIRKKKLKEMNRLRKRLEEIGPVTFRFLAPDDDVGAWTAAFLALENSGWKGEAGTSFKSDSRDSAFLTEALRGACDANALQFARLDVGGKPIAMLINFGQNGEAYGFKIAHDEAYARYSPGVMIEIELLRALQSMRPGDFIDSCAAPGHPMINSLWPERRRLVGYNIGSANPVSAAALRVYKALEAFSENGRRRGGASPVGATEKGANGSDGL